MGAQASAEREVKKYLSCLGDNPIVRPLGEGGEKARKYHPREQFRYHFREENMKKKPDLMVVLLVVLGAGLLISSVAQSGLL